MTNKYKPEEELFSFINSETPAARTWVKNYLTKKGIPITIEFQMGFTVAQCLEIQLNQNRFSYQDKKILAYKMANAWRGYRHRKKKNVVSLTVSLDKSVLTKLKKMGGDNTQAEIITKLINHDFRDYLTMAKELKLKETEAKLIEQENKRIKLSQKISSKPVIDPVLFNEISLIKSGLNDLINRLDNILSFGE